MAKEYLIYTRQPISMHWFVDTSLFSIKKKRLVVSAIRTYV